MADYYPLIINAIVALDKKTSESRRVYYDRARAILADQLRKADPPLSETFIERERSALEDAISKVEACAILSLKRGNASPYDPLCSNTGHPARPSKVSALRTTSPMMFRNGRRAPQEHQTAKPLDDGNQSDSSTVWDAGGEAMSTITLSSSLSSLSMAGKRLAKCCRGAVALDHSSPGIGSSGLSFGPRLSFAPRRLMMVLVDSARVTSSWIQALRGAHHLAGALSFLAFNILLIIGAAVLFISRYGAVVGLTIVVLAVAPVLALLSVAIYAAIE